MAERREGVLDEVRPQDDFAAWVSPHLAVLSALAVREVGAAEADDVVQDALLRAWRRIETYRAARGTPRAWLVAVLLDQARRHRARHRPLRAVAPGPPTEANSADRLDMERAVRALPRRQAEVITLFYLADLGVAEIATVLSISPGSVKSHLSDARAALRRALETP